MKEVQPFKEIKKLITNWIDCVKKGDTSLVELISKEIERANKLMEKEIICTKLADYTGIIALPVGVAESILYNVPSLSSILTLTSLGSFWTKEKIKSKLAWRSFFKELETIWRFGAKPR